MNLPGRGTEPRAVSEFETLMCLMRVSATIETFEQRTIKKIKMKNALASLCLVFLAIVAGCATQLDTGAEKVRVVGATQKEFCESLGIISTDQQLGLNKASNAMNKAVNEVARRGGNAIFVLSTGTSGLDGAAVTAEALRCK